MLARRQRLTRGQEFTEAVRRGRRAGSSTVVLHLWVPMPAELSADPAPAAQVGFVVGKAVGGAVIRNEVKRRLRHVAHDRLEQLPPGSLLVVRAQPAAAGRTSSDLARDFDTALGRLLGAS